MAEAWSIDTVKWNQINVEQKVSETSSVMITSITADVPIMCKTADRKEQR